MRRPCLLSVQSVLEESRLVLVLVVEEQGVLAAVESQVILAVALGQSPYCKWRMLTVASQFPAHIHQPP